MIVYGCLGVDCVCMFGFLLNCCWKIVESAYLDFDNLGAGLGIKGRYGCWENSRLTCRRDDWRILGGKLWADVLVKMVVQILGKFWIENKGRMADGNLEETGDMNVGGFHGIEIGKVAGNLDGLNLIIRISI